MKKFLFTAVAAALPLAALAQSSVTAYGRIDLSVEHLSLKSTPTRAGSSLNALTSDASLLGFRGTEDLGGGSQAYFKLETGVSMDSGSQTVPTAFWNREAYVGLGNATFGSVQLGSQWAPALFQSVKADPFQRFGPGGQYTLMQGLRGYTLKFNNTVQYISPNIGGLSGRLYAVAGEGVATGKAYAGSIDYAQGPLFVGAFYEETQVSPAAVGLAGTNITSKTTSVAGTYDFKVAKLHAQYQTNDIANLSKVNAYLVGLTVPLGQGEVRASYSHRSATNADASLFGLGYIYFMSKRTHLYGTVASLNNSGTAAFRMGPATSEQASLGSVAGQDTTGTQVGIRHFF